MHTGAVSCGYESFTFDLSHLILQPAEWHIVIQSLETNEQETVTAQWVSLNPSQRTSSLK